MPEQKVVLSAKIGILLHCLVNVYENVMVSTKWVIFILKIDFQILTGKIPFLTKGPWAMFFGGEEIVPELSDRSAGRHLLVLYMASITFSLAIAGRGRLNVHCTADFIVFCCSI